MAEERPAFQMNQIYESEAEGTIHYNLLVPDGYDGSKPYALHMALPGWEGLYFQGVGEDLRWEYLPYESSRYADDLIVVSAQLNDWGMTSARQAVALTEYFLSEYNIDPVRVYITGYSGGGETLSRVLELRPEMYTTALFVSSQWDGDPAPLVKAKTPVYLFTAEHDSYYGSDPVSRAYQHSHDLYVESGLPEEEIAELLVMDIRSDAELDALREEHAAQIGTAYAVDYHGAGMLAAFNESVMNWVFGKTKEVQKAVDSPSDIRAYEEPGWSEELMMRKPPFPAETGNNTVLTAHADAHTEQALFLWEPDNMPSRTSYTSNAGGYYYDDPDFRPYVTTMPVPEGVPVKGAVLLCAGGAFQFRGDYTDTIPTAEKLNQLGFQCFIVDYRLHPYTQEEGALDLARAVRFVRKNADVYGIDPNKIAVMGYSAGGIQAGEMLLHYDGLVNGTALDASYVPDELDAISADAGADGMIYSFYGRLSVASKDVDALRAGNLPPTYFCYGTRDPFVREFEANIRCLQEAGVEVEALVLQGWPHGYGAEGSWVEPFAAWLEKVFNQQ